MWSSARERPPKPELDLNELGVPLPSPPPFTLRSAPRGDPTGTWPLSAQIDLMSPRREGAGTEREYR